MAPKIYPSGHPDFIYPGSDEHSRLMTASKVAAVLGISRWESAYSLWHRMKGLVPSDPARSDKDTFRVGHAFELGLAELWKLENPGWKLSKGEVQYVRTDLGFPAMATIDRRASRGRARRVVEFKTARDLSQWGDEGTGDCPADFAAQVTFQMLVTGYTKTPAHLNVMGPFFKHFSYTIDFDPVVAKWIATECQKFVASLAHNTPPELDTSIATYEVIRQMHPEIDGTMVEVDPALVVRLRDHRSEISRWDAELRRDKAQLLTVMGNAEFAAINGTVVAQRRPHQSGSVVLNINNRAIDG